MLWTRKGGKATQRARYAVERENLNRGAFMRSNCHHVILFSLKTRMYIAYFTDLCALGYHLTTTHYPR